MGSITRKTQNSKRNLLLQTSVKRVAELMAYVKHLDEVLMRIEQAHPEWFPANDKPPEQTLTTDVVAIAAKEVASEKPDA